MSRKWFLAGALLCVLGAAGVVLIIANPSLAFWEKPKAPPATAGQQPVSVPPVGGTVDKEAQLLAKEQQLLKQEADLAEQQKKLTTDKNRLGAIDQVVALYGAMPPSKAATLMGGLDTATAIEVLRRLDNDQAAQILAQMDPAKGSALLVELAKPAATTNAAP